MVVHRIARRPFIQDLSGYGARTYGGRWNSVGTAVVYTAGSLSLALLELLVHVERPVPEDFWRIELDVPDSDISEFPLAKLPTDWEAPIPTEGLQKIGDGFVAAGKYLGLKLPSSVNPQEWNLIINPAHPRFSAVRVVGPFPQPLDKRLYR
jgi:RES domain-containing protein